MNMSNIKRKIERNKGKNNPFNSHYSKEEITYLQLPEYHTFVFQELIKKNETEIKDTINIEELHISFFKDKLKTILDGEDAWNLIKGYNEFIEEKLKDLLINHSISFWFQLYRRVGLSLLPHMGRNTDEATLNHIRSIVETSITKYAELNKKDIGITKSVKDTEVLGGLFERYYRKYFKEKYDDMKNYILSKNVQVLTDFTEDDYLNMYKIERLAHEYWWTTAVMRSIGKGASIYLDKDVHENVW